MPTWSTEAKNLDDEWKIHENLTQPNKVTEEHSQQKARRAQPTASEKSTTNSTREEHNQQHARIKRTERAVPTAVLDVRREQCLEERSWTDDEKQRRILKVINAWQQNKNGRLPRKQETT